MLFKIATIIFAVSVGVITHHLISDMEIEWKADILIANVIFGICFILNHLDNK